MTFPRKIFETGSPYFKNESILPQTVSRVFVQACISMNENIYFKFGTGVDRSQLEILPLIRSYLSRGGLYLMGNEVGDVRLKNAWPTWRGAGVYVATTPHGISNTRHTEYQQRWSHVPPRGTFLLWNGIPSASTTLPSRDLAREHGDRFYERRRRSINRRPRCLARRAMWKRRGGGVSGRQGER